MLGTCTPCSHAPLTRAIALSSVVEGAWLELRAWNAKALFHVKQRQMCPECRICLPIFKNFRGESLGDPFLAAYGRAPPPLLMTVRRGCSVFFLPPPHVGRVREEFPGIDVKGVGEKRDPPASSSPGPTPFSPTNAKLLPTQLEHDSRPIAIVTDTAMIFLGCVVFQITPPSLPLPDDLIRNALP